MYGCLVVVNLGFYYVVMLFAFPIARFQLVCRFCFLISLADSAFSKMPRFGLLSMWCFAVGDWLSVLPGDECAGLYCGCIFGC